MTTNARANACDSGDFAINRILASLANCKHCRFRTKTTSMNPFSRHRSRGSKHRIVRGNDFSYLHGLVTIGTRAFVFRENSFLQALSHSIDFIIIRTFQEIGMLRNSISIGHKPTPTCGVGAIQTNVVQQRLWKLVACTEWSGCWRSIFCWCSWITTTSK